MEMFLKMSGENSQRHSSPKAMKNASRTRRAMVETQIESDARNQPVLKVAPTRQQHQQRVDSPKKDKKTEHRQADTEQDCYVEHPHQSLPRTISALLKRLAIR